MSVAVIYTAHGPGMIERTLETIGLNCGLFDEFKTYKHVITVDRIEHAIAICSPREASDMNIAFLDGAAMMTGGLQSVSKMRNIALQYAYEYGYEWCVILDSDGLLLTKIDMNSGDVYRMPIIYPDGPVVQQAFYLVIRRPVFAQCRYHEGYVGYSHEDCDFVSVVLYGAGYLCSNTVLPMAYHRPHEPRIEWKSKLIDENGRCPNIDLFERRLAEINE